MIEPIQRTHFEMLELQDRQLLFNDLIHSEKYRTQILEFKGYSLIKGLDCIGMAGIIDAGHGRGIAWALLSKYAHKYMYRITKETLKIVEMSKYDRIEMTVEKGFDEAYRWAEMLGFKVESEMKNYCDGKSHYMFVRLK